MGVNWSVAEEVRAPLFEGSNMNMGSFRGLSLKNIKFTANRVHEADFQDCDLTGIDASDTDFAGTLFHRCKFAKANFTSAYNYQIDPTNNDLKSAKFSLPEAVGLLIGFGIVLV